MRAAAAPPCGRLTTARFGTASRAARSTGGVLPSSTTTTSNASEGNRWDATEDTQRLRASGRLYVGMTTDKRGPRRPVVTRDRAPEPPRGRARACPTRLHTEVAVRPR